MTSQNVIEKVIIDRVKFILDVQRKQQIQDIEEQCNIYGIIN